MCVLCRAYECSYVWSLCSLLRFSCAFFFGKVTFELWELLWMSLFLSNVSGQWWVVEKLVRYLNFLEGNICEKIVNFQFVVEVWNIQYSNIYSNLSCLNSFSRGKRVGNQSHFCWIRGKMRTVSQLGYIFSFLIFRTEEQTQIICVSEK